MNIPLLKRLGNIDQLAGVRLKGLESGNGAGSRVARVWNARGFRSTRSRTSASTSTISPIRA